MACACKDKQSDIKLDSQINSLENIMALTDITDYNKLPTEHCAMCAEKHFATAYALSFETGYLKANGTSIVDELICAIWHMSKIDKQLAMDMASIKRLAVVHVELSESVWANIANKLYEQVNTLFDIEDKTEYDVMTLYRIIGELVCSGWHAVNANDKELAAQIRLLRHKIQHREAPAKEDWINVMSQVAATLDKELQEEQS